MFGVIYAQGVPVGRAANSDKNLIEFLEAVGITGLRHQQAEDGGLWHERIERSGRDWQVEQGYIWLAAGQPGRDGGQTHLGRTFRHFHLGGGPGLHSLLGRQESENQKDNEYL